MGNPNSADSKVVKSGGRSKPPAAGKGRTKGTPNKVTKELKDMILNALDGAGGVEYLISCANEPRTASAFLGLVGKVLPMTIAGSGDNGALIVEITRFGPDKAA
jgi:hypothetical protein